MAKARRRLAESWSYRLLCDRALDPSEQTVFHLNPLTQAERLQVRDDIARNRVLANGTTETQRRKGQVELALCLTNIASIENFPVGAPTPWPADHDARRAYLEQLDDEYIEEIGAEIYGRSAIGELEKNSLPPEPTSSSGNPSPVP